MSGDAADGYLSQGDLDPDEAKRILSRLEQARVRFQIATDVSGLADFRQPLLDARVQLFVHKDDVPAWHRIRQDFFPA